MHGDSRGYYAALQVAPDATRQEIGRSFRSLMRRHHPDVGNPPGGGDVRRILEAFAVLRNPVSRAAYDRAEHRADAERHAEPLHHAPHGARDIPVRHIRHPEPLLRVTPVRWEHGPGPGPR